MASSSAPPGPSGVLPPPPPSPAKIRGAQSEVRGERVYRKTYRPASSFSSGTEARWPVRDAACMSGALGFRRELRALRAVAAAAEAKTGTEAETGSRRLFRAPRVYEADERERWLLLDDCGATLDTEAGIRAAPADWRRQMHEVLRMLERADLYHNDVHPGNVCVEPETGVVRLIDFGWATSGAPSVPEANPRYEDVWEAESLADFFDRVLARAEKTYAEKLGERRARVVRGMRQRYATLFRRATTTTARSGGGGEPGTKETETQTAESALC